MTGIDKDCLGCAWTMRRFRGTQPRSWCRKYHQPATARCVDYKTKRTAIEQALNFLKAGSLK